MSCISVLRRTRQNADIKMKALQSGFINEVADGRIHFNLIEIEGENQETIDQCVKGKLISLIAFQPHKRSLLYMMFTRNITKKIFSPPMCLCWRCL